MNQFSAWCRSVYTAVGIACVLALIIGCGGNGRPATAGRSVPVYIIAIYPQKDGVLVTYRTEQGGFGSRTAYAGQIIPMVNEWWAYDDGTYTGFIGPTNDPIHDKP